MDYMEWANKNRKRIAREFIRKTGFISKENPTGIFTAGLPGAGKTEFTVQLLKNISDKPLRIDMDEIATLMEGYGPELAHKFRGGAGVILGKIYDETIKNKIDFVFDGTFSHGRAIENLERALHKGYQIKVYIIFQLPEVAWQFTKDRELLEHRSIDRDEFIQTYLKLETNLRELCKKHKDVTVSLIVKDSLNKEGRRVEDIKDLFGALPDFLTVEQLENVIT